MVDEAHVVFYFQAEDQARFDKQADDAEGHCHLSTRQPRRTRRGAVTDSASSSYSDLRNCLVRRAPGGHGVPLRPGEP
jgi:hypothetical protein